MIEAGLTRLRGFRGSRTGYGRAWGPASTRGPLATVPTLALHPLQVPPELEERHGEQQHEQRVREGGRVAHAVVTERLHEEVVGDGGGRPAGARRPAARHHEDLVESL